MNNHQGYNIPPGNNPFQQPPSNAANTYSYDVQTTYMPHVEGTVPAVPNATVPGQPNANFAAAPGTQSAPNPQQGGGFMRMPFMSSTALPTATGTIGQAPGKGPAQPGQPQPQQQGGPSVQQGGAAQGSGGRDTQPLLPGRPQEDYSKYAFYNIRRYRPYFDVDTKEVLWRVGSSFIGAFRANFMQVTQERPDLYGPFWIATTLIFVTAVAGNYANYIEWRRAIHTSPPSAPPPAPLPADVPAPTDSTVPQVLQVQWFTDYNKLGASAGIFYGYTFVLSLILWLVLRYLRADMRLVNMFCVYGYAMTIFIPISVVCIIPIDLMRWLLVMGGTLTSGLFLLMNLKERIMPAGAGKAVPLLFLVFLLHAALGLALKLYFFSY